MRSAMSEEMPMTPPSNPDAPGAGIGRGVRPC